MALDELAIYLRLTPEFGGTRFGPFETLEIRLGSNADRCHIVLPEALGVIGEHVKVIRQGPSNLILAPADRTATIFLWRQGDRRPTQVTTPTAVRPADSFSLVTAEGPRFIVELDVLPPEVVAQRAEAKQVPTGRRRLTAEALGNEVKRQAWTRLLTMGPMQLLQRAWTFVRSGAIYQPRNIILGITILGGYILGGTMACTSCKSRKLLESNSKKIQQCDDQLALAKGMSNKSSEKSDFTELAGRITGSMYLVEALKTDDALRAEVRKAVKSILSSTRDYDWLLRNNTTQQGRFADWRERVVKAAENGAIDNETAILLPWLASRRSQLNSEFQTFQDSEGTDVCGRGPLRMTYRQALHLGLSVSADGYHAGTGAALEDVKLRDSLFALTLGAARVPIPEGQIESSYEAIREGQLYCVYVTGADDDRTKPTELLKMMKEQFGPSADKVPPTDDSNGAIARIAKYWAADATTSDYREEETGQDFSTDATVSSTLEKMESRGAWVRTKTAETLAQAIAVPCLASLSEEPEAMKGVFGDPPVLPDPVPCLILNWKLTHEKSN